MTTTTTPALSLDLRTTGAALLLVLVLVAYTLQTQLAGHVQHELGYAKPYFLFYITHSGYILLAPLHLAALKLTGIPIRPALKDLVALLAYNVDVEASSWRGQQGWVRELLKKVAILTVAISAPALSWYGAVPLTNMTDITAIYNVFAFWAYLFSLLFLPAPVPAPSTSQKTLSLACVVLAVVGVLVIAYGGPSSDGDGGGGGGSSGASRLVGNGLALFGSVAYAGYEVWYKLQIALPFPSSDDDAPLKPLHHARALSSRADLALDSDEAEDAPSRETSSLLSSPSRSPPRSPTRSPSPAPSSPTAEAPRLTPALFLLYANCLTSLIGLCTLVCLWVPLPLLHWVGWEVFEPLPREARGAMVGIVGGGVVFNGGFMLLLSLWGPVVASVANLLTLLLVALSDQLFSASPPPLGGATLLGGACIVGAFGGLIWGEVQQRKREETGSADSTPAPSAFLSTAPALPCYLAGKPYRGSAQFDVKDPHDPTRTIHACSSITVQDVPHVVEVAQKAARSWKSSSVIERRNIFIKAAAMLRARTPEFAQIEFEETTSSAMWSGFEMGLAADSIEEVAAAATNALRGEIATTEPHQRAYLERCPYGVVLGIAPWNAPMTLGQRAVLQPIMAGNAAILKTSEMSPRVHMIIAEIMHEAGLPEGVLSIVHVAPADAPAVTEALIAHDAIRKVNFTGSTRVGAIVAQTCGKYLKPVVLELGGKAPAIVCEDADLKHAANAIKFGGLFHSGQICMATATAIVHESVADEFASLLAADWPRASSKPDDGAALRGLFTQASAARVADCVEDAVGKGAQIIAGQPQREGNVLQPVLLKGIKENMRIYKEEMFAPAFSILTFTDDDKAIFYANDHEYGLAASVFTSNIERGHALARQIDAGMVHINGATVHDHSSMPHGGWKSSGFGRFNGIEGIREFTQIKVITVNPPHASYPAPSA
ncbi:hypothetical protein JCM10207_009207 [Rhodosporidiobolus poonsookiae]